MLVGGAKHRFKTTFDSSPVCLDMVRIQSEKNHVAYGLASAYSVRTFRMGLYVDQSSSRGLEKFGEDISTSAEVIIH